MGLSKKSYLTPPPSNPCHPCNRSLLEAYSYRPSSLHSTRSISRARSRADQQSPAPRTIQIAHAPPTHGSVCENSRSNPSSLRRPPHPFLVYTFPLQSRTPAPVALLGDCFLVHLPLMLNQETVSGPFGLPCFPFEPLEPLLPTASPVSDSPLLSLPHPTPPTTNRTFSSPPLSCKELRNVTGLNVETSGLQWTRLLVSHLT